LIVHGGKKKSGWWEVSYAAKKQSEKINWRHSRHDHAAFSPGWFWLGQTFGEKSGCRGLPGLAKRRWEASHRANFVRWVRYCSREGPEREGTANRCGSARAVPCVVFFGFIDRPCWQEPGGKKAGVATSGAASFAKKKKKTGQKGNHVDRASYEVPTRNIWR